MSSTQASNGEFQNAGKPVIQPVYLNDPSNGTPLGSVANPLNVTGGGGGTQYTDGAAAPAHPTGTELVFNNAGTMTAVSVANALPITGSVSASNPSVGATESAIPTSATLLGANDNAGNLEELLLESNANPNLRIAIFQAGNQANVTGANALKVDNSGVTQPISAVSLPLPTGAATVAKQPALGTAGSASTDVLSIQGIASMTPLKVDGSGVTQPVSGTITANAGTGSFTVAQATGSNLHAVLDSGSTTAVTQATGSNLHAVLDAGSAVVGSITIQATSGTALVADQANSEIRVSNYVTKTTAGDTALTLGSAIGANSLPVVVASDQSAIPVSQNAATSVNTTLQNAQSGNANGTRLNILGQSAAVLTVNMVGFTGTVNFEGQEDGTNFGTLNAVQIGTNTITSTATGSNTTSIARYEIPVAGLQQIQARTSGVTGGTVTITGHAVPLPYNGKVINANIVSPALGQATMANSLPVTIASNQTSIGSVTQGSGAAAGTNWRIAGDFTEQSGLSAGALNADLVPSTDVSLYKWLSLHITAVATGGTITFQGSNDNINFVSINLARVDSSSSIASTSTVTAVWTGPVNFRYFRARQTAWTSGTTTGVLELYTSPSALNVVGNISNQAGTWTVQPGNTQNTTPWMMTIGPTNVGTQVDVSATGTNATVTATMSAVSAKTNYITGYEITGLPATSLSSADVTISGLQNTLTAEFAEPVAVMGVLQVAFNPPRAASAVNTAISVSVAALGVSSSKLAINVHGFTV